MKIVRRSIAQLLRVAGTPRAWSDIWRAPTRKVAGEEIELLLVTDPWAASRISMRRSILITSRAL